MYDPSHTHFFCFSTKSQNIAAVVIRIPLKSASVCFNIPAVNFTYTKMLEQVPQMIDLLICFSYINCGALIVLLHVLRRWIICVVHFTLCPQSSKSDSSAHFIVPGCIWGLQKQIKWGCVPFADTCMLDIRLCEECTYTSLFFLLRELKPHIVDVFNQCCWP